MEKSIRKIEYKICLANWQSSTKDYIEIIKASSPDDARKQIQYDASKFFIAGILTTEEFELKYPRKAFSLCPIKENLL